VRMGCQRMTACMRARPHARLPRSMPASMLAMHAHAIACRCITPLVPRPNPCVCCPQLLRHSYSDTATQTRWHVHACMGWVRDFSHLPLPAHATTHIQWQPHHSHCTRTQPRQPSTHARRPL